MSYLWAVEDQEIQSQAIWEISTWSAWPAAPRSCHIHWVDWLKLSISLLFGFQWRQNLAMALEDVRRSSGRWQVFTVSILCQSSDWSGHCQGLIWLAVAVVVVLVTSVSSWRLARADWLLHSQLGPSWDWEISCWGLPGVPLSCPSQEMLSTLTTSSSPPHQTCHWHSRKRTFITLGYTVLCCSALYHRTHSSIFGNIILII